MANIGHADEFDTVHCLRVCRHVFLLRYFSIGCRRRRSSRPIFLSSSFIFFLRLILFLRAESRAIDAIHSPAGATGDLSRKSPVGSVRVLVVYRRISVTRQPPRSPGRSLLLVTWRASITMKMNFHERRIPSLERLILIIANVGCFTAQVREPFFKKRKIVESYFLRNARCGIFPEENVTQKLN